MQGVRRRPRGRGLYRPGLSFNHFELEKNMKKFALLISAVLGLLSGCVAYDTPYRDRGDYRSDYRDEHRGDRDHDRDRDGVRDRDDRHPDDPRR